MVNRFTLLLLEYSLWFWDINLRTCWRATPNRQVMILLLSFNIAILPNPLILLTIFFVLDVSISPSSNKSTDAPGMENIDNLAPKKIKYEYYTLQLHKTSLCLWCVKLPVLFLFLIQ